MHPQLTTPRHQWDNDSVTGLPTQSWDSLLRPTRPISPALNPSPALTQMFMATSGRDEIEKMRITDSSSRADREISTDTWGLLRDQQPGTCQQTGTAVWLVEKNLRWSQLQENAGRVAPIAGTDLAARGPLADPLWQLQTESDALFYRLN